MAGGAIGKQSPPVICRQSELKFHTVSFITLQCTTAIFSVVQLVVLFTGCCKADNGTFFFLIISLALDFNAAKLLPSGLFVASFLSPQLTRSGVGYEKEKRKKKKKHLQLQSTRCHLHSALQTTALFQFQIECTRGLRLTEREKRESWDLLTRSSSTSSSTNHGDPSMGRVCVCVCVYMCVYMCVCVCVCVMW